MQTKKNNEPCIDMQAWLALPDTDARATALKKYQTDDLLGQLWHDADDILGRVQLVIACYRQVDRAFD